MKNNWKLVNFSVSFQNWQITKLIKQIGSSIFLIFFWIIQGANEAKVGKQLIVYFFAIILIVSFWNWQIIKIIKKIEHLGAPFFLIFVIFVIILVVSIENWQLI